MPRTLGSLMEAARIQSEINRLFDNLLDIGGEEKKDAAWLPNADIVETEQSLLLRVELPGVDAENLRLSVHGGNVIIKGEKRQPEVAPGTHFQAAERQYGSFRRVIHLGVPVNTRLADAALDNGLLRICFPKVPNRRGEEVRIEVQS